MDLSGEIRVGFSKGKGVGSLREAQERPSTQVEREVQRLQGRENMVHSRNQTPRKNHQGIWILSQGVAREFESGA